MVGVSAFAILASHALPLAGATACSLSRGPIVEDFVMADAAFVGTIQGYEAVKTWEPFDDYATGLLTVRVDKVLHGEISGTVLIRYFRAEQALAKESIFAVVRDREFGEKGYKWNAQRWPRKLSQYDKVISALQGIGEPITVWDVGTLGCGSDFFYPYDRTIEEQIVAVVQKGVPQSIVEQRHERYAQDAGTPIKKPIEYADFSYDSRFAIEQSRMPKIEPNYRYEFYVYILAAILSIGGGFYFVKWLDRKRRKRKPA